MAAITADTPIHPSDQQITYPTVQTIIGEPLPSAEYESHEAVENAYQQHALDKGYGVVKVDTGGLKKYSKKKGRKVVFGCDRWGKYDPSKAVKANPEVHESKRRKGTSSRKCNCPFRIFAIEDPVTLKWKAFIKEEHHNHDPSSESTSHPSHRRAGIATLPESSKQMVDTLRLRNTPVSTVRAQLGDMGVKVTSKDLYNMKQRARNAELGGLTAVQWLYDTLQELRWFCRFDTDPNVPNRVTRIFFAHPGSVQLLKGNPDVILLDCTYKTNRFNMPLLNICGVTGNNMTPQIAMAFLSGEKEVDYGWAMDCFQQLLNEYGIDHPKCFVTDRELALMNTLDRTYPSSDHILCRWHVNMNVVAKCKKHFKTKESFEEFYELWAAVLDAPTEEQYVKNVDELKANMPPVAFKYISGTWLIWREKVVSFDSVTLSNIPG
jgi:hypothetical protein